MARPGAAIILLLALLTLAIVGAALLAVGTTSPAGAVHNGLIAYDSNGDIWVADPDGSDPRVLIGGPSMQVGPVWSPDGRQIAYWERVKGDGELSIATDTFVVRVADADGQNDHVVTGPEPFGIGSQFTTATGIRWSSDARWLTFAVATPHDPGGPGAATLTSIMVAAADGSDASLLELDVPAEDPIWQPGGDVLAFRVPPAEGSDEAGVWVVGSDGSDPHRVVVAPVSSDEGYAFTAPLWSASGSSLVYGCCDYPHDIWVANLDGSEPHVVAPDAVDEYWPAWAPTGDRIAFQRQTKPNAPENDIIMVNADGSDPRRVDVESTSGTGPMVWSPEGTEMLGYTSYSEQIVIVTVDGSRPAVFIPAPAISYFGTVWSWQPLP
jgi:Tol biopolymer transport system component